MATSAFTLENLTCESCVKLCTMKFKKIAGVQDVAIDLATGAASVEADREIPTSELSAALEGTHYSIAD